MTFVESTEISISIFLIILSLGCILGGIITFSILNKRNSVNESKNTSTHLSLFRDEPNSKITGSNTTVDFLLEDKSKKVHHIFALQASPLSKDTFYKQLEDEIATDFCNIFLLTQGGEFFYANQSALASAGFETLEALNSSKGDFLFFLSVKDGESFISKKVLIEGLLKKENSGTSKFVLFHNIKGTFFPTEVSATVLNSQNNTFICIVYDSLNKPAFKAPSDQIFFEYFPKPHILLDANMNLFGLSQSTLDLFGVRDFVDSKTVHWEKFLPGFQSNGESTKSHVSSAMEEAILNGCVSRDITFLTSIGEPLPCDCSIFRCYMEGTGKPIFCIIFTDLRANIIKEASLEFGSACLEQLLEASLCGAIIEQEGKILWLNSKIIDRIGCSSGERLEDFFEFQVSYNEIHDTIQTKGYAHNTAISMYCKKGELLHFSYSGLSFNYKGKPSVLSWLYDLTEIEQGREDLIVAQNAAEEGFRVKNSFLARMSHEVRTPMNAILGMSHLCLQTQLDTDQHGYLVKLQYSAKALLAIFDDILDYSKMDTNEVVADNDSFSLAETLDALMNQYASMADSKKIELTLDMDFNISSRLFGDCIRLSRVLSNILSNALKFTHSGEITLSSKIMHQTDDYSYIHFAVTDTGIGIDKGELSNIYELFMQVEDSITRRYSGSGIGLSVAQRLVESMGGNLEVQSTLGVGTKFFFTLAFEHDLDFSEKPFPVHKFDILEVIVIDDNPTTSASLVEMLEGFSFHVESASSGEEGIQLIERLMPNFKASPVIVIDHKIIGIDGFETAKKIRQVYTSEHDPIIIIMTNPTAHVSESMITESGVQMVLRKPILPSSLYSNLVQLDVYKKGIDAAIADKYSVTSYISGAQILLVEDNEINQEIAKALLLHMGVEVDVANNGLEAIEAVRKKEYDLIFMDIQMPEMDGLTATREIRALGIEIPIMAMTAHSQESDRESSFSAGMNGHFTKPLDPDVLAQALSTWIKPKEMGVPVEEHLMGIALVHEGDTPVFPLNIVNTEDNLGNASNASNVGKESDEKNIFDYEKGVSGVGGNQVFYIKLLGKFKTSYSDVVTVISTAISSGDDELTSRTLHTVKGLSASLGMPNLALSFINVEKEHKLGEDILPLMPALTSLMKETFKKVDVYMLPFEENAAENDMEKVSFHKLNFSKAVQSINFLKELLDLFESDWEAVLNVMQELRTNLVQTSYEEKLKTLDEKVENFDIMDAFIICNSLIRDIEECVAGNHR